VAKIVRERFVSCLCSVCGCRFGASRGDAKTCSAKCRKAKSRKAQKLEVEYRRGVRVFRHLLKALDDPEIQGDAYYRIGQLSTSCRKTVILADESPFGKKVAVEETATDQAA